MSHNISPAEILYVNLTAKTVPRAGRKPKIVTANKVVFGVPFTGYTPTLQWEDRDDRLIINKFGVEEDLVITMMEVISRHGFRNK